MGKSQFENKKVEHLPSIIVYGAGDYYQKISDLLFSLFAVVAIADSNKCKQGDVIDGFTTISPDRIADYQFDYIVIASSFDEEIKSFLISNGFTPSQIKTLGDFPLVLQKIEQQILIPARLSVTNCIKDSSKIKVSFLINSLGAGGAEKALISLLKNIDYNQYHIFLYLFEYSGFYLDKVPKNVEVIPCFLPDANMLKARIWLKHTNNVQAHEKLIHQKTDIEIAFIEGWATKIVAGGLCSKKVAWVHTNLQTNPWTNECYETHANEMDSYKAMDSVVFVSEDACEGFANKYFYSANQRVIANIIDVEKRPVQFESGQDNSERLVYVGRLTKIKGVDRLITVFAKLVSEFKNLQLLIIGEGEQKMQLEDFVRQEGLTERVHFLGFLENPFELIQPNDIFVNPSNTEGYPLAVAEAMINGIAVIATKCTGNCEILNNGEFGALADNSVEGIYQTIKNVLLTPNLVQTLRLRSKSGQKQFDARKVLDKVDDLIKCLVKNT